MDGTGKERVHGVPKDRRRDFYSREKEMPWGSWHVVMWMKGIENIAYHGIAALGQELEKIGGEPAQSAAYICFRRRVARLPRGTRYFFRFFLCSTSSE